MQYFSQDFSKAYLRRYCARQAGLVAVYTKGKFVCDAVMITSKEKGKRVMITTNWMQVVDHFDMNIGDIYLFWFRRAVNGVKLIIRKVE